MESVTCFQNQKTLQLLKTCVPILRNQSLYSQLFLWIWCLQTMQEQWKSDCENELRRHLQCYHSGVLPNAPIVIDYIRAHWPEVHRGVDEDLKTVIRQGSVWVTGLRCKVRKLTKQAAHATKIKCRRR